MPISKILVPVDFSSSSTEAWKLGADMAEKYQASLVALHVVELGPGLPRTGPVDFATLEEELNNCAKEKLEKLTKGTKATYIIIPGWPFRPEKPHLHILEYAQKNGVDLIVMGTHGKTGWDFMVLGSTAEQVLRKSTCPVLILPPAEKGIRKTIKPKKD